jgi:hypothetical protein
MNVGTYMHLTDCLRCAAPSALSFTPALPLPLGFGGRLESLFLFEPSDALRACLDPRLPSVDPNMRGGSHTLTKTRCDDGFNSDIDLL